MQIIFSTQHVRLAWIMVETAIGVATRQVLALSVRLNCVCFTVLCTALEPTEFDDSGEGCELH